jgi:hypothetical protein
MAAVIMRQSFRQRAYFLFTGVLLVGGVTGSMAQREVDPLTLARRAYNLRQYDQAVMIEPYTIGSNLSILQINILVRSDNLLPNFKIKYLWPRALLGNAFPGDRVIN